MKALWFRLAIAAMLAVSLVLPPGAAPSSNAAPGAALGGFVPGRVLVKFRDTVSATSADIRIRAVGAREVGRTLRNRVRVLTVAPGAEGGAIRRLTRDSSVEYAEPDYYFDALLVPNDPLYGTYQWNLPAAKLVEAWNVTTGSPSVVVATIDSGAQSDHPDLAGRMLPGRNFSGQGDPADTHDGRGHGTHVAGTIGAVGNNGVGVAGVAWQTRILPVKVLTDDPRQLSPTSAVVDGMSYAVDQGARILNMSIGTTRDTTTLRAAVADAQSRGVLIVAAAGNAGEQGSPRTYPAAYDYPFAIVATNRSNGRPSYSNVGSYTDVAAPGGDRTDPVYSTFITSTYAGIYGTSQATPHVSGLAALMLAVCPSLTPTQTMGVIMATAKDIGSPGRDPEFGAGLIDAGAAVGALVSPTVRLAPEDVQVLVDPAGSTVPSPLLLTIKATDATGIAGCSEGSVTLATSQPWLLVNGASSITATTPATITVSIDATRVPSATRSSGTITVTATFSGPQRVAQSIPVTVTRSAGPLSRTYFPVFFHELAPGW